MAASELIMGGRSSGLRRALLAGIAFGAALLASPSLAALPHSGVGVEPRLAARAASVPGDTLSVWITFTDKGERGPSDLAARLAAAESRLEPRTRARRIRAGVTPLVDSYDLPVEPAYLEALKARGLAARSVSRWMNGTMVRLPGAQIAALAALPFVRALEVPALGRRMSRPEEPLAIPEPRSTGSSSTQINYGQLQSPLTQIAVPAVHDSGYIGTGMLVCIVDEGFNHYDTHEALVGVDVVATRDFVDGDLDVQNLAAFGGYSHGTWTMGCLAGRKAGTYVGSAYGASFLLARTENNASETPVEMVNWGLGAEWADSAGADVISSSLGYSTFDNPADNYTYADMNGHTTVVTRAAEIAASKGILVVTAVGNEGAFLWRKLVAPSDANGDSVIAVGAVDAAGAPAGFSSHGPSADGRVKPDLTARGVSVPVPDANGQNSTYAPRSGTSFSTPILAGLATCLLQARPGWPPRLVIDALRKTASRYQNPDTLMGYGIPNGLAALQWTPDTATVPPLPPATFAIRLAGPNPFASNGPPATVQLDLGASFGTATPHARVFDTHGRMVRELEPERGAAGRWSARWDGLGTGGLALGSGMYFITFEAAGRQASVRVVSLR